MEVQDTSIQGLKILKPNVFEDERGFFLESFNSEEFERDVATGVSFVQDNHSKSSKNTLRGLHLQTRRPQGKLVRATEGRVFDVAVDCRPLSVSYGNWFGIELSATNYLQLWLPAGLAHGFLTISDSAEVQYKTTDFYDPGFEISIKWDCPLVGIEWPMTDRPNLSEKDLAGVNFSELRFNNKN